jgi:hypothetical protein
MPQGDYDEALKRALYISAEWLKIFNTGKEGCRVVGMLMQDGWDDAAMLKQLDRTLLFEFPAKLV